LTGSSGPKAKFRRALDDKLKIPVMVARSK